MSTLQRTSNKATIRRFQDATNTHDAKLISRTIDEFVEPDALNPHAVVDQGNRSAKTEGGVREAPPGLSRPSRHDRGSD